MISMFNIVNHFVFVHKKNKVVGYFLGISY